MARQLHEREVDLINESLKTSTLEAPGLTNSNEATP